MSATSNSTSNNLFRVGSRSSELAMKQSATIIAALKTFHPSADFQIITMKTLGDRILDKPLPNIGEVNLFTKELESALAAHEVDFIVHSLKDLPTTLPEGMRVSAIYERDDPTDALVLSPRRRGMTIETLPPGSTLGTSSLRRVAQLKRHFPHLEYASVRGNLNTRLSKLDDGTEYDAIVLATAGLVRLGWEDRISQTLGPDVCMYAVGQGALAVESRVADPRTNKILQCLNDPDTLVMCSAERSLLRALGGGCSVPLGVHSAVVDGVLKMEAAVFSLDGKERIGGEIERKLPTNYSSLSLDGYRSLGDEVGRQLADSLVASGVMDILERARLETEAATATLNKSPTN